MAWVKGLPCAESRMTDWRVRSRVGFDSMGGARRKVSNPSLSLSLLSIRLLLILPSCFCASKLAVAAQRFDAIEDWLRLEDHAFSAAEGTVVHGAMAVVGEVAQVSWVGDGEPRRWRWPGSGFRGRAGRRRSWGRW